MLKFIPIYAENVYRKISGDTIMNKKEFYKLIKAVPKTEVHIHIEAVPSIDSIKALFKKNKGKEISDQEIKELFTYDDLNGFIQAFIKIQQLYILLKTELSTRKRFLPRLHSLKMVLNMKIWLKFLTEKLQK